MQRNASITSSDMDDYIILDNPDFIPELSENTNYESDSFNIPRNSKDMELNSFGRELVGFCRSYEMYLLDGRKDGDREGNFTCITNGGRSIVDYVLVNTRIYDWINSFHVITRTESDHFPMTFKMKFNFADAKPSASAIGNLNSTVYK